MELDLDEEVASRIGAAMAGHEADREHLTEAQVREWIERAVADVAEPPTIPADRLPDERLIFGVDPNRPETMNADRRFGQAWAASNMFQLRQTTDFIAPSLPTSQQAGYGLTMGRDGAVHSWPMADGTTVRYGPIERAGQKRFRLASQFRGVADGYRGSQGNLRYVRGQIVGSGGWRINTLLNRQPGHSDARSFDGTRSGLHAMGANIAVGPDAETIVYGWEMEGTDIGGANLGGPVSLHEPGHKLTGPFAVHQYRGKLIFGGKSSKSDQPLDYESANQTRDLVDHRLHVADAPQPGERVRFVVALRVDRTGRRPLFELWRVTDRDMELLVRKTHAFGYGLEGKNNEGRRFYPIVQEYLSGEWAGPGSRQVRDGMMLWNYDPAVPVYALEFGTVNVAQGVTVEEMGSHLLSFPI